MNNTHYSKQMSDKLSICLSMCCILHCIALPFVIIMIPSFASFWINSEIVHLILVILAIPVSLFAMLKSLTKHHNYKSIILACIGLLMLVAAIFMHDIEFITQHVDSTNIHEENNVHGDDHHEHEEHGGIGEILETIFTVLGGLVLLGSHLLNIRLTNNPI